MKYILNKTPIRTSNNFRINDIKLDLDMPSKSKFKEFKTNKDISINYEYSKSIKSNLGLELNNACIASINIDKSYDSPLILEYTVDDTILNLIINIDKDISANIIIKVTGNSNNILVISSNLKEDSYVTIDYINMNEGKSFISFENTLHDRATSTYNIYDLCGELRLYNYENNSNSPDTKEYINNMYITKNEEILDINYYVKLKGIENYGSVNVRGCIKDKSKKSFKGTIDFIEGSKKSIGRVKEDIISLSDEAISSSLPMILCHEEDFCCSYCCAF